MSDEALLREILDAQLELVCRFRADGTILFVNRAYARSLDRDPADLTGENLWDFVTGEDQAHVRGMLEKLTPGNPELTIENRFETAGGTRWMLWHNHALEFDENGAWSIGQSTGIDITDRKELEVRLELLVSELNHRVKNTLMVVKAMAHQSFRGSRLPGDAVAAFNDRLIALAGAHDALSRANWVGANPCRGRHHGPADLPQRGRPDCDVRTGGDNSRSGDRAAGHGLSRTGDQCAQIWIAVGSVRADRDQLGDEREWSALDRMGGNRRSGHQHARAARLRDQVGDRVRAAATEWYGSNHLRPGGAALPHVDTIAAIRADRGRAMIAGKRILVMEDEYMIGSMVCDMLEDAGAEPVGPIGQVAEGLAIVDGGGIDAAVIDWNLCGESGLPVAEALAGLSVPFVITTGYGAVEPPFDGRPLLAKPYLLAELTAVLVALLPPE